MKTYLSLILVACLSLFGFRAHANETITSTFTVVNGYGYMMNMWNVTTGAQIEIYTNSPTKVQFTKGDVLFIGKNFGELAKLVVDDVIVPPSLCQSQTTFYDNYGYLLTEDCGYYPTDGGTVEIYQEDVEGSYKVTFSFTNDGTQDFLKDVKVGNSYYRDEELEDALSNGLLLNGGTFLELTFNTIDYAVNSITANGQLITGNSYSVSLTENINFVFDVTPLPGKAITVKADDWQHILVSDPSGNSYTLTGEETVLALPLSIERLFFNPAAGYEIPENGIVATDANGVSTSYNGGDGVLLAGVSTITIRLTSDTSPSGLTFYFACEADVIDFIGGTAATGNPDRKDVKVTSVYQNGTYTVSNVPEYLTISVKADVQAMYKLGSITAPGVGNMASANGISAEFSTQRFPDGSRFSIDFTTDIEPRYITVEVNNPSCIGRVYGQDSGNITDFPAQYDLNKGSLLTVEAAYSCTINGVKINGKPYDGEYPTSEIVVNLTGVPEGAVVTIDASSVAGEITYRFQGAEGLKITYRSVDATYANGTYTLNNILNSNDYNVTLQVASAYKNSLILVEVTDGKNTWYPAGASGVINIPGSEMPKYDTNFTVTTRIPDASETNRTVYLTIDETSVVSYGKYQGPTGYFGFGTEGIAPVNVSPTEYVVEIVTTEPMTGIESDVDGTVSMPILPSLNITLDLKNAVEGQTISIFTEDITLRDDPGVTVDTENAIATVTVNYSVSTSLVGKGIDVIVNGTTMSTFTPNAKRGEFVIYIADLKEGENTFSITARSAHAEDSIEARIILSGIDDIFVDEKGNDTEIFNLQGVRMEPGKLIPGYYIVNGQKVLVR